jgi:hypothetical protein
MAGIGRCPACGESEELRGEPSDGDIKITCLRCAAQWMRGAPPAAPDAAAPTSSGGPRP